MRLIAEIAVVAALIALGWSKPFAERLGFGSPAVASPASAKQSAKAATPASRPPAANPPASAAAPANAAAAAKPSPTVSGAWMWDANRPGSLDRKGSPQPERP